MPSIQHEGVVELIRQHPPLAVELLRHVGTFAIPDKVLAVLGSEDMSDVAPRRRRRKPDPVKYTADSVVVVSDPSTGRRLLAVIIEPQGQASDDKDESWPVYVTTARRANKCVGAVLITVCWDEAEADKCRKVIRTGHPGLIFIPVVIDPRSAPDLTEGSPYLIIFTGVIGGIDLDTDSGARTVIQAIADVGGGTAYHRTLTDIILGVAPDAARDRLEELMAISYRSPFIDSWIQKGEEKGKAEGKAEGQAEGEARAKAQAILKVLNARDLQPTAGQRKRVTTCMDLSQLDTWFDRALTAASAAEVFKD